MSEEIIRIARTEYVGYFFRFANNLLDEAKTINEALFIIHANINNNMDIYNSIPIIEAKENYEGSPIKLRGENNFLTKSIYYHSNSVFNCRINKRYSYG